MRVAVLEAVCAGLCGESPEPSLLAEGRAMWQAVVDDLLCVPGCTVDTVADRRWLFPTADRPGLHLWETLQSAETVLCWDSALEEADAALIIAPEIGGVLEQWVSAAAPRPRLRLLNCDPAAIRLCTDKLALSAHLGEHGIPAIPTTPETWTDPPQWPCVLKPRDGAGSWLVRRVDDATAWRRLRGEFAAVDTQPLRQPFVPGRALSVAAWFCDGGVDWLPIAEQRLSDDGRFRYFGGRVPADLTDAEQTAVMRLVQTAAATIPGLFGYVGFDVLQPTDAPREPLLVEINPRFTTSYVGYRRLFKGNLFARWLMGTNRTSSPLAPVFGREGRGEGMGASPNDGPLTLTLSPEAGERGQEQRGTKRAPLRRVEFDANGTVRELS
jgi:tyramine---L-glutamate ligase